MSNPSAAFGLLDAAALDGAPFNFGLLTGKALFNVAAFGKGDLLAIVNGELAPAAVVPGGAQVAGVASMCSWNSTNIGRRVWQAFYPSNDSNSNADIDVRIDCHPNSTFRIRCANNAALGPVTQASVGKFANFSIPTAGSSTSGGFWKSGYMLDDNTISAIQGNLPLKIVAIEQAPVTDPTAANNIVRVQLVNLNAGV
jgi:hypothetical protein